MVHIAWLHLGNAYTFSVWMRLIKSRRSRTHYNYTTASQYRTHSELSTLWYHILTFSLNSVGKILIMRNTNRVSFCHIILLNLSARLNYTQSATQIAEEFASEPHRNTDDVYLQESEIAMQAKVVVFGIALFRNGVCCVLWVNNS